MVNANFEALDFTDEIQARLKADPQGVGREFAKFVKAGLKMPVGTNLINMDAPSQRAPKPWKVRVEDQLPNVVRGEVAWDAAKSTLYLSEKQTPGQQYIGGHDLRKELEAQKVYTDQVVDFYLDHPEVPTPKEWLGKWIFCWGRIYRVSDDILLVRCLYCNQDGSRDDNYNYLDNNFNSNNPALVVAGNSSYFSPTFCQESFFPATLRFDLSSPLAFCLLHLFLTTG